MPTVSIAERDTSEELRTEMLNEASLPSHTTKVSARGAYRGITRRLRRVADQRR